MLLHHRRIWRTYWASRPAQHATMISHADLLAALEAKDSDRRIGRYGGTLPRHGNCCTQRSEDAPDGFSRRWHSVKRSSADPGLPRGIHADGFGRPLVNAAFAVALVTGQSVSDVSQNVMANLGLDEVRLPNPLFEGATVYSLRGGRDPRIAEHAKRRHHQSPYVGLQPGRHTQ
jgi:hypothetical protein